jgi:hypothetical protein
MDLSEWKIILDEFLMWVTLYRKNPIVTVMNKRSLFFIIVVGYCDGSFDSFCIVGFDRIVTRCSTFHCFTVTSPSCGFILKYCHLHDFGKYCLCVICSCDFVVRYRLHAICSHMSPLRDQTVRFLH